jgi:hypothetical protein
MAKNLAEYKAAASKLYGKDADAFPQAVSANTDAEVAEMGHTAARERHDRAQHAQLGRRPGEERISPVRMFLFSRVPHIPVWSSPTRIPRPSAPITPATFRTGSAHGMHQPHPSDPEVDGLRHQPFRENDRGSDRVCQHREPGHGGSLMA